MNIDVTVVWSTAAYQSHYMIVYYVTSKAPCTNGRSSFLSNSAS